MVQEKLKKELIEALERELVLHKQVLSLLDEEKDNIVKGPVGLNETVKKKDAIIENIHKAEEIRQRLVVKIAGVLSVSVKDVTLAFLAKAWSEPKLMTLRKELKVVLEEIKNKQKINNALVQHGLAFIDTYVNLLANNPKDAVYDTKGNIKDSKSSYYRYLNQKI